MHRTNRTRLSFHLDILLTAECNYVKVDVQFFLILGEVETVYPTLKNPNGIITDTVCGFVRGHLSGASKCSAKCGYGRSNSQAVS